MARLGQTRLFDDVGAMSAAHLIATECCGAVSGASVITGREPLPHKSTIGVFFGCRCQDVPKVPLSARHSDNRLRRRSGRRAMMVNRPHPRLRPSRRTLIAILLAGATTPLLLRDQVNAQGATASAPRPFRVDIPQATIDRIINRVRDAEWPDRLDASDWRYGTNWDYMKTLAEYWAEQYNWRKAEANLNRYPQFLASVGDFDIHFYHVMGRGPRPVPLILTHGWPGSVYEFLEAIGPLSDPVSFGGSADDAFDLVVPSLPGYGFSSKPSGKPIGPVTTAALWNRLMTEVLGYTRYGAQGGDLANGIMRHLGLAYRDSLVGLHFNNIRLDNVPAPPESEQSPEERAWRSEVTAYLTTEFAYNFEQRYKPQTVALALSDNPVGAAAWMV